MGKIILPTEKSSVDLRYSSQKIGMIGASGIGKSAFFAQDPKVFFIEAEAGLNFEKVFKLPARCWEDLREIYAVLKEAERKGDFPYSVVVLDTIDRIVDFAEDEIMERAREYYKKTVINSIGDIPEGGGWRKTKDIVMTFMHRLEELPCAIAYIGHLTTKRIEEGGRKYDKHTISLWKGIGNDILAWGDHTLHVTSSMVGENLQRTMLTKPSQSIEAKSRGGIIPHGMKWGDNMQVNYKTFRKLFT